MGLGWPVKGPVSQYFGSNPNSIQPNGHTGVDFAVPVGTPIYAAESGVIDFEGWASTLSASNIWWIAPAYAGITVLVNHGNGLISLTGHMSSTVVDRGQRVAKGQLIGYSGNTGLSTGPHVHYEILGWPLQPYNGFYGRLNPSAYISGYAEDANTVVNPSPVLGANQRKVGPANLNQRAEANTGATVVRTIQANTVETFTGYVRGQEVSIGEVTSNIWYKDDQGYVWSGGFTSQSTDGLPDRTPAPPLAPNERRVNDGNVNQRATPSTASAVVRIIAANSREKFDGFVRGENVTVNGFTSDIWYKDGQGYAWAGGFTPSDTSGLADLTPVAPVTPTLQANQRLVGPVGAVQRDIPSRAGNVVRSAAGGTVETFTGYVRGESVTIEGLTSDVWYKDDQGYMWAGGFTSQDTAGLSDLTPKPADPEPVVDIKKTVYDSGVRVRTLPFLTSTVKEVLAGDSEVQVRAYVEGDTALDSNIWFVLDNGFAHSSGFDDPSTEGLPKIATPMVTDDNPSDLGYAFVPDFDFVEYRPAHYDNMGDLNFPANPALIVIHQFDAKEKRPSIDGVIKHFQTSRPASPSSAHFVVSGKRIVQMVSLKDRAFHAGTVGNDYIGIEVDPQEDAETVASVKKLIAALNERYKKIFSYIRHRDVPQNATLCGADIHLELYKLDTPPVVIPDDEEDEEVIIPPVVNPDVPPVIEPTFDELVDEILEDAGNKLKELWHRSQEG